MFSPYDVGNGKAGAGNKNDGVGNVGHEKDGVGN